MARINLSDFKGSDDLARFASALDFMKDHPGTTLFVEPGVYNITTELARETQKKVMNGEFGSNPEPVMFNPKFEYSRGLDFYGHDSSRIEAYGVTFMIDGFMEPISIRNCKNIEICGLTIDHVRKPYSRATVTKLYTDDCGVSKIDAVFSENFPITPNMPVIRDVVYNTHTCRFEPPKGLNDFEFIDEFHARFSTNYGEEIVGNELYIWHTFHSRPAVLIEEAENTVLKDITVHSHPGNGYYRSACDGYNY